MMLLNLSGADLRKWMPRDPNPQHIDEAKNVGGPNRCLDMSECDGFRTCSSAGWCQGWAGV